MVREEGHRENFSCLFSESACRSTTVICRHTLGWAQHAGVLQYGRPVIIGFACLGVGLHVCSKDTLAMSGGVRKFVSTMARENTDE